jgi:hypothetical protein
MLDAYAIRTHVALNRPALKLTVQVIQREILQKNQRCNDGRAVDRDRSRLSHRPAVFQVRLSHQSSLKRGAEMTTESVCSTSATSK